MQHEEHKLERMRTKIALAEMQLLRGQTAVREADLLAEFRDDDSDSDSAEGFTSPGALEGCRTVAQRRAAVWLRCVERP